MFSQALLVYTAREAERYYWHYLGSTAAGKEGNEINYLRQSRNAMIAKGRRLRKSISDWLVKAILISGRMFRSSFPVLCHYIPVTTILFV
uniref:Transposase n=1 Tax=Elaeophora elaphi TaxID=1147741 RepID=A0A0R3S6X6_9BILA